MIYPCKPVKKITGLRSDAKRLLGAKKRKSSDVTPVVSILKQDIAASVCTCSNAKNDEKRKPRVSSENPGYFGEP